MGELGRELFAVRTVRWNTSGHIHGDDHSDFAQPQPQSGLQVVVQ